MKLSIVTINYNNKEGLRQTIDSVIPQTFKDFEWIIIDGGSTDGSKNLIEKKHSCFSYWCSEPDKGIYNAMNKGIAHAKGDYLLFLNSGDCFVCPETLEMCFATNFSEDFVSGKAFEKRDDKLIPVNRIDEKDFSAKDLIKSSLPHQSTFIRREMFDKFGLYDESLKIVSDWKFFWDAIVWGNASLRFIPDTITIWQGGGISTTQEKLNMKERQQVLSETLPFMIIKDYGFVYSLSDIYRRPFFKVCYKLLYRIAMMF